MRSALIPAVLLTAVVCSPHASAQEETRGGSELQVDLSENEYSSIEEASGDDVDERDWFRRVDVWGFGAAAYLRTGRDGTRPDGALLVNQASLFLEAEVAEQVTFLFELQTDRFGPGRTPGDVRAGEVYGHFRRLHTFDEDSFIAAKVGRFDIPFGEYYHRQDATDNALISYPVALPYNVDEGLLVYGTCGVFGWTAAILDGTLDLDSASGLANAGVVRLHAEPCDSLYVSASGLVNGEAARSAICFSGIVISPVGAIGASSAGVSPSAKVRSSMYSLDARWRCHDRVEVHTEFGQAWIDDSVDAFDRDFLWFTFEPVVTICEELRAVFRWSEAGTYDSREGYVFEAKPFGGGTAAFGYDTKRVQRISGGLNWKANKNVLIKLEGGLDRYWVIDASSADPGAQRRGFVGLEVVLSF